MRPILLCIFAVLAAAAPAGAKPVRCDVRPGFTIIDDGTHRVYETVRIGRDLDKDVTTVKACRTLSRRPSRRVERYRNDLDARSSVTSARTAGRWLLLDVYEETGVTAGHALRLFDLRRHRYQASIYADGADAFDYVLTTTGAFAAYIPYPGSVVAFDATGKRTLAGEAAKDLAAAGRRVYWTEVDVSASAVLGGPPKGFVGDFG